MLGNIHWIFVIEIKVLDAPSVLRPGGNYSGGNLNASLGIGYIQFVFYPSENIGLYCMKLMTHVEDTDDLIQTST